MRIGGILLKERENGSLGSEMLEKIFYGWFGNVWECGSNSI
jgi:hypothetical protein